MDSFKYLALMFLSLIGISSIIKTIILLLYKSRDTRGTLVITISNNDKNAEEIIRNKATNMRWSDSRQYENILCIGKDLDNETRDICIRICGEYSNVEYRDSNIFEKNEFFGE